jgi:hypothetical protein
VQVEGRNKFHGQIGQLRGNRAIRITRVTAEVADMSTSTSFGNDTSRGKPQ